MPACRAFFINSHAVCTMAWKGLELGDEKQGYKINCIANFANQLMNTTSPNSIRINKKIAEL